MMLKAFSRSAVVAMSTTGKFSNEEGGNTFVTSMIFYAVAALEVTLLPRFLIEEVKLETRGGSSVRW